MLDRAGTSFGRRFRLLSAHAAYMLSYLFRVTWSDIRRLSLGLQTEHPAGDAAIRAAAKPWRGRADVRGRDCRHLERRHTDISPIPGG